MPVMAGAMVGVAVVLSMGVLAGLAGRRTASVLGVLAVGVLAGLAGLAALMSASL